MDAAVTLIPRPRRLAVDFTKQLALDYAEAGIPGLLGLLPGAVKTGMTAADFESR